MGRIEDSMYIEGVLGCTTFQYPALSLTDAAVSATAAIAASKSEQHYSKTVGQNGTAVTATIPLHIVRGLTGDVKHVCVMNRTACGGASTVTVDVQKAGVSILTGVVTLNSASAAYTVYDATILTDDAAEDDVYEVVITTSASGTDALATGIAVTMLIDEDYRAT